MITLFVPTSVGPTKLDLVLDYCIALDDEAKQKVILITDISRLTKLLGGKGLTVDQFENAYSSNIWALEQAQHILQVEWNTKQHHNGYSPIQGHNF